MTPTDTLLSDLEITDGLAVREPKVLQYIYVHWRPLVVKAVQSIGGSTADGNVFFQTALIDLNQMLRQSALPEGLPLSDGLVELGQYHFSQWNSEHQPSNTESSSVQETTDLPEWLPTPKDLSLTRSHIYVWKTLGKLSSGCKSTLLEQPIEDETTCKTELAIALNAKKETPLSDVILPSYAIQALQRKEDYTIWATMRQYEQHAEQGRNLDGSETRVNNSKTARWAFLALVAITLGYIAYTTFNQPKSAQEIFEQNFTPPQSLLADMNRQLAKDSSNIERPQRCDELIAEADAFYANKNYAAAQDPLIALLNNDDLAPCFSDANLALAIIALKTEDPTEALQYLSKIDNIEAYGEDLYWYQTLAFVQMAKRSKSYRPVAQRAIERLLENTQIETRRKQAEQMLEELN